MKPLARRRRSLLLLAPALLFARPVLAARDTPVIGAPGRVARLRLGKAEQPPTAQLDGRRLLVRKERGEWVALAGIPLSAKVASKLSVSIEQPDGTRERRRITVVDRKYSVQYLTVAPDQADLP